MKSFIVKGLIILCSVWLVACAQINEDSAAQEDIEEKNPEEDMEDEIELFIPQETDVIQLRDDVENLESMDQFVKHSESKSEDTIRYVIFESEDMDPIAVYTLKAVTDPNAKQSWVEISRDYQFDQEGQDLIEPQQCSGVSKNIEWGSYYLNECFHTWEIQLMSTSGETGNLPTQPVE